MTMRTTLLGTVLLGAILSTTPTRGQDTPPAASTGEVARLADELRLIEYDKRKLEVTRSKLDSLKSDADAAEVKYRQKDREVKQLKTRIDSEKRELKAAAVELNRDAVQLKAEKERLDRTADTLKQKSVAVKSSKNWLTSEGNAIDRERPTIRTESHRRAFNARVERYNAKVKAHNANVVDLQQARIRAAAELQAYERNAAAYTARLAQAQVRVKGLRELVYNHDTGVGVVARYEQDWVFKLNQYNLLRNKVAAETDTLRARQAAYEKRLAAVKSTPAGGVRPTGSRTSDKPPPGTEPKGPRKP